MNTSVHTPQLSQSKIFFLSHPTSISSLGKQLCDQISMLHTISLQIFECAAAWTLLVRRCPQRTSSLKLSVEPGAFQNEEKEVIQQWTMEPTFCRGDYLYPSMGCSFCIPQFLMHKCLSLSKSARSDALHAIPMTENPVLN